MKMLSNKNKSSDIETEVQQERNRENKINVNIAESSIQNDRDDKKDINENVVNDTKISKPENAGDKDKEREININYPDSIDEKQTEENRESVLSENIIGELKQINEFISSIKEEILLRNERDKYKDEAIVRMSNQISDFEQDMFKKIKEGLLKEFISFYEKLLKVQAELKNLGNEKVDEELDYLVMEVDSLLFNNGVEEIELQPGVELNRSQQKIKTKIEVSDQSKDNEVKEVIKKGFKWSNDGNIIKKQEVIVYSSVKNIDQK